MLTGQNGILNRAAEAKEKTELASIDEQRKLAQSEALMNTEISTYKGVYLPEGFAPTKIEGEDSIDDGLVITDGEGNEYVWVEVPKTEEVYPTAGINIINFTDEEYIKIEDDLHTYTKDYRNGTSYNDIYHEDGTVGWFSDVDYYETKKKMLKSLYENKGFWVSRYEAGTNILRTAKDENMTVALSQANLYPYTYITRTQAKILAEKVESGSYTSNLMFGVQWDLILKYIEMKKSTTQEKLKTNSTPIGNYYTSEFILYRGKFANNSNLSNWFVYDSNEKKDLVLNCKKIKQNSIENSILLTTGATDATKLQNIYDVAGNVWEWTLDYSTYTNRPCVSRGGGFNSDGTLAASSRTDSVIAASNYVTGFRIAIY